MKFMFPLTTSTKQLNEHKKNSIHAHIYVNAIKVEIKIQIKLRHTNTTQRLNDNIILRSNK